MADTNSFYATLGRIAGNAETALLPDARDILIDKPIYICGLARAGSTLLLETLAAQPNVATHRYQDYPFIFTPYIWNKMLSVVPRKRLPKHERAHGDRLQVNRLSPEALEEMLWMAFFPQPHHLQPEVMGASESYPEFETFYRDHIRKLLLANRGSRYTAKNNYLITRIPYLLSLFPDARFIIPVRDPATHIVSLMRQHQRFCAIGERDAHAVKRMSASGHFEFGLNRIPIHAGDEKRLSEIQEAWHRGEELRGWALYWDSIYRFVHETLEKNPTLKKQSLIIRFEDLCAAPQDTLQKILRHAALPADDLHIKSLAAMISAPDYYASPLNQDDLSMIRRITGKTAQHFGYAFDK